MKIVASIAENKERFLFIMQVMVRFFDDASKIEKNRDAGLLHRICCVDIIRFAVNSSLLREFR